MEISVTECQKKLSLSWFIGAGIMFVIILFQTFLGHYAGETKAAWNWFFPNVTPTLSLMIGVIVASRFGRTATEKTTDRFIFRLAFGLSLIYLFTLLLTILVQPFTGSSSQELFAQSHQWLVPLQGLVTASLGAFFVKSR